MPDLFLVFDVKSIGLHGEGFAVGWVVVDRDGLRVEEGSAATDPVRCIGTDESHEWVGENVPQMHYGYTNPRAVRDRFWHIWRHWANRGAVLVADCAWPVEARFLAAAVDDDSTAREWQGPYPLHDLASIMLAIGCDPLRATDRLPDELPAHHPLHDARQSARLLVECLRSATVGA